MIIVRTRIEFTVDTVDLKNLKSQHIMFKCSDSGYYSGIIRAGFVGDDFIITDDEGDSYKYINVTTKEDVKKALEDFVSGYSSVVEYEVYWEDASLKDHFEASFWDEEDLQDFYSSLELVNISNI